MEIHIDDTIIHPLYDQIDFTYDENCMGHFSDFLSVMTNLINKDIHVYHPEVDVSYFDTCVDDKNKIVHVYNIVWEESEAEKVRKQEFKQELAKRRAEVRESLEEQILNMPKVPETKTLNKHDIWEALYFLQQAAAENYDSALFDKSFDRDYVNTIEAIKCAFRSLPEDLELEVPWDYSKPNAAGDPPNTSDDDW